MGSVQQSVQILMNGYLLANTIYPNTLAIKTSISVTKVGHHHLLQQISYLNLLLL